MNPLEKATLDLPPLEKFLKDHEGLAEKAGFDNSEEMLVKEYEKLKTQEIYLNDIYQVNVIRESGWVHLSIKRRDKEPVTDWRHKQAIKNQLVGEECEGVELYPAESRLVDTANQYHLWCLRDPAQGFPIGFGGGRFVTSEEGGGSTFTVWLPLDPHVAVTDIVAADGVHPAAQPWRKDLLPS